MIHSISKLFKHATWHYETKRPYPIRDGIFRLPMVEPAASNSSVNLAVLAPPDRINNAAWTARSILTNLTSKPSLTIVVDGRLSTHKRQQLQSSFYPIRITDTAELVRAVSIQCPPVAQLASYHPMGKKLAAILQLQSESRLIFSDDDVLAFGHLQEVDEALAHHEHTAVYLKEGAGKTQQEPAIQKGIESLGLSCLKDINVGFLVLPKDALNLKLCNEILDCSPRVTTWFPDTALLAALLAQTECRSLPSNRYVCNVQRQFSDSADVDYDKIALRHFVTPVRHLMYLRGMPRLLSHWGKYKATY